MTNHIILPAHDVTLAVLEGTPVEAFCGEVFVPTVIPGTSGQFFEPNGDQCEPCEESQRLTVEWNRLRHEKNRLLREMNAISTAYKNARREWREQREKAPELEEVSA